MLRKGRPSKHTTGCCGLKDTVEGLACQLAGEHKTRQVKVGPGGSTACPASQLKGWNGESGAAETQPRDQSGVNMPISLMGKFLTIFHAVCVRMVCKVSQC